MKRYEEIDHTGDVGILIYGKTMEALYENAGFAYFDLICDLSKVEEKMEEEIEILGDSPADILRKFLVKLLLFSQIEEWLFSSFEVREFSPSKLVVMAKGEPFSEAKHQIYTEIKAVTYHLLEVARKEAFWWARVIFDI